MIEHTVRYVNIDFIILGVLFRVNHLFYDSVFSNSSNYISQCNDWKNIYYLIFNKTINEIISQIGSTNIGN